MSYGLWLALMGAVGCAGHSGNRSRAAAPTPEVQTELPPAPRREPQPEAAPSSERDATAHVTEGPAIPAADSDSWTLAQGVQDGRPTLIRYRPGLSEYLGHPAYPRRLKILWKYGDDGRLGLPTAEQSKAIDSFENRVVSVLDPDRIAVLAFVYTSRGVREWDYYVWDVAEVGRRINEALRDEPVLPIELQVTDDPHWNELRALLEGVQSGK